MEQMVRNRKMKRIMENDMNSTIGRTDLWKAIDLYVSSFEKILYEEDTTFMEGMKEKCLAHDDIRKYQFWEWTQGVGLYGFWKLYKEQGRKECLEKLLAYYDARLADGLPAKNVNTTAPMLTLSFLAEDQKREDYAKVCREWAEWIMESFPRTREGGFQHMTSDSLNNQQLWDDTLFMTVLFLANMGRIEGEKSWKEEAEYQFLLHLKYLADRRSGLWYHGWSFEENSNFAQALWGRGNCWITAAIPEFLEISHCEGSVRRMLEEALKRQAEALTGYQDADGMWHTLIDDPQSYPEASATCGFGYGMLKGVHMGILEEGCRSSALKAIAPILSCTDETGVLHQVSYGTAVGRDLDFYRSIPLKPMPYGQALAMLFLAEAMKDMD